MEPTYQEVHAGSLSIRHHHISVSKKVSCPGNSEVVNTNPKHNFLIIIMNYYSHMDSNCRKLQKKWKKNAGPVSLLLSITFCSSSQSPVLCMPNIGLNGSLI